MEIIGVVCGANAHRQRYAISTHYGFSVADLIDGDLSHRDYVEGDLECHGQVFLTNHTTGEIVEVYVEAVHATREHAIDLLRNI